MHVLVLRAELHLPQARSLKAKRSVVKSALAFHVAWLAAVA